LCLPREEYHFKVAVLVSVVHVVEGESPVLAAIGASKRSGVQIPQLHMTLTTRLAARKIGIGGISLMGYELIHDAFRGLRDGPHTIAISSATFLSTESVLIRTLTYKNNKDRRCYSALSTSVGIASE
jgi:hypothetical protein